MLVYQRISWMMTPEMLGFRLPSPLRQQVLGIPNAGVAHHGLERNPMDVEPETHPSLEVEIPRKFPWCHGSDQSLCHFLVVKPSQTIHAYPCLVRAQLGAHRTIHHGHKATSYWWYYLWGRKILKQPAINCRVIITYFGELKPQFGLVICPFYDNMWDWNDNPCC